MSIVIDRVKFFKLKQLQAIAKRENIKVIACANGGYFVMDQKDGEFLGDTSWTETWTAEDILNFCCILRNGNDVDGYIV